MLLVAGAAVATRRWRLARDLLLAGVLGWLLARGLGLVLADGFRPGLRARRPVPGSRPSFPNVQLTLLVGGGHAPPGPYLTRARAAGSTLRWWRC